MNATAWIAAAHLVGFIGAWVWSSLYKSEFQAPTKDERSRWITIAVIALALEQALLATRWHVPFALLAGVIGGFAYLIQLGGYPTVVDDYEDDTPMLYAEAAKLAIVAATLGGCLLAFTALVFTSPSPH